MVTDERTFDIFLMALVVSRERDLPA